MIRGIEITMIKKLNIFGWKVWVREQNELHYISSLQDYLDGKASIVRVFKQNEETKVCLVETTNGLYVIKDFSPNQKHIERFLKSWIKKDYYVRLFQQTAELFNQGQDAVNDFYLLALCCRWHYAQRYVMIIEYIDGVQLPPINAWNNGLRQEISQMIENLHNRKVVSGDIHRGNFIQQIKDGKIRIIDLSGKRSSALRQAEDRVKMEQNLGIVNEKKDWAYRILKWKHKWRQGLRAIRGRS